MIINTIDNLTHQRIVLEAAPERRKDLFQKHVVEPLRPFWEPMLARMPAGQGASDAMQFMGVYDSSNAESDKEALERLAMLARAESLNACRDAVEQAIRILRPEEHGVILESLLFALALGSPKKFGKEPGYTGSGGQPGQFIVVVWPNDYNVPRLPAIAVHEFHHNVRLTYEPWTQETTVGQYLVIEGLAEAFAAEMCGEDKLGPWVHSLNDAQHEEVKPRYRDALHISGFNEIRGYIFGDLEGDFASPVNIGLPPYSGYSVGYRMVNEYLRRSGKSAAEATYVPWREVVEGSCYF
ncbi:DUF2268 domain-containing protein [Paenibacillus alkalitolerans]|uniref:DUF2268 domain-containing protein n=1 Tax=Paenibacillus alkalitolerans TaxID=2799335 RepID=UPI0018F7CC86|nr:DUF2268 domain-containing putative Zn-dependent protease [Paenibacillus alkalitolerans]